MNKGQGSIARTNKVDAVVIPPATVTGADNGLTLLGTIVELGGPLIKNTSVESGFFDLSFGDNLGVANGMGVIIDNTNQIISVGDTGNVSNLTKLIIDDNQQVVLFKSGITGTYLSLDTPNGLYQIGDILLIGNRTKIDVKDASETIELDAGTSPSRLTLVGTPGVENMQVDMAGFTYLLLDLNTMLFRIGDIGGVGNGTKIDIKDASQAIELDAGTSPARLTLVGNPGTESLVVDFAASPYFSLDPNTGNYFMGDLGGVVNQTTLTLSDSVSQAAISSLGFTMLFLDMLNGIFQLGASAGGSPNLTYFEVNDTLQKISGNTTGVQNGLLIDFANDIYTLGDYSPSNNGTLINVQDAVRTITASAGTSIMLSLDRVNFNFDIGDLSGSGNSTKILITDTAQGIKMQANSGVGINQYPTLSPFSVAALQPFANNAAAVAGGLGVGDFYRISVLGTSGVAVVE